MKKDRIEGKGRGGMTPASLVCDVEWKAMRFFELAGQGGRYWKEPNHPW